MTPLRVLLVGAHGRMGQAVAAAAAKDTGLTIVAGVRSRRSDRAGNRKLRCRDRFQRAERDGSIAGVRASTARPLVLGTTGHIATQERLRSTDGRASIPIVFAANFSVGVNALFALTRRAAELLGDDFDLDVIEMHHRTKKDAPSGTAKRLLEILKRSARRMSTPELQTQFDSGRRHRGRPHRHLSPGRENGWN